MKGYIHVRDDIANTAAWVTFIAANPTQYKKGSIVVIADGVAFLVQDSAGTYVTFTVA